MSARFLIVILSPYSDPMDFESEGRRSFTFNESNFETPYCFQVTIIDDDFLEYTEMFDLTLSAGSGVSLKNALHVVEIEDNDSELYK